MADKQFVICKEFQRYFDKLHVMITFLFNAMLTHSVYPDIMNIATILPLVKDKRASLSSKDNYRGIALTSPLGKAFDNLVVNRYKDKLITSDNQFGYKEETSTNNCTLVLKDVISYFKNRGSDVYVCLLDASKAFDKIDHFILFKKLLKRKIPILTLKLLLNQYKNQVNRVCWNGTMSYSFKISNGVRQGSVLSSFLFCIYVDDLSIELNNSAIGCTIYDMLINHLLYAD